MTTSIPSTAPTTTLSAHVRAFLDAPRFASIATVDEDGGPRQGVVWYLLEGDTLVINSRVGRRWPSNLVRDQRIAVSVIDTADGYRWLGLTGRVEVVDDPEQAQADIAAMARRYHHADPARAERMIERTFRPQRRISFRIHLEEIHDHLD
jgi:PPOX class probable F420-dependent enzyme